MYTMNRCQSVFSRVPVGLLVLLCCAVGVPAAVHAQQQQQPLAQQQGVREFPAAALRATLSVSAPPDILLNGNRERLAPGARIRNTNNMLVVPAV